MQRSELSCAMSVRVWGWLLASAVALGLGVFLLLKDDWHPAVPILGLAVLALGLLGVGCVAMTRRSRLVADATSFSFRNWRGSRSIDWSRLSSLQIKNADGGAHLVVINDMGRKEMDVPVHLFDPQELHDWLGELPTRTPGRERLLR